MSENIVGNDQIVRTNTRYVVVLKRVGGKVNESWQRYGQRGRGWREGAGAGAGGNNNASLELQRAKENARQRDLNLYKCPHIMFGHC